MLIPCACSWGRLAVAYDRAYVGPQRGRFEAFDFHFQDLVDVLADGQWWLHKDGWNCDGGGLDRFYNHPVFSYHDVRLTSRVPPPLPCLAGMPALCVTV